MNCCIAGLQWGDEGKGKVVDILAEQSDLVVRYNGGANAGHTVIIGDQRFALHLLPSGAIRPRCRCIIANGVVVDPAVLMEELGTLNERGISLEGRLFISENAHVVLDYHKLEDRLREEALGKNKIGTTERGIGPCYADKVGRSYAVRMADFRKPEELKEKLRKIVSYKNKLFSTLYNAPPMEADAIFDKCMRWRPTLLPCITNTTWLLFEAIDAENPFCLKGPRGPCWIWTTARFPMLPVPTPVPWGWGRAAAFPPAMWIGSLVWPRPTPRGSAADRFPPN